MKKTTILAALLLLTACDKGIERLSCSEPNRQYYQQGRNKCFYVDPATGQKTYTTMDKCSC
ncbi:putative lipoprotein YajG [Spirosoma sp. LMG 31448]|uniref:Lipoprotein YajG n=1 Tax=Spirosoma utsteinense TaxID=2585773 RepID=A0ABR6W8T4_9BACT|nr:putative lipoprotein YajG [Spirosoma utsteinense]MBC3792984.1 putative lipoprotein YajG [Spirosoma utsteinense]